MKTSHRVPNTNDLDGDVHVSTVSEMLESRDRRDARFRSLHGRDGSQLARGKGTVRPLGLTESLFASVPVGIVDLEEMVHEQRRHETDLADEASQRPRRVRASREAKDEDLVSRAPVGREEVVRLAHVLGETATKSTCANVRLL